MKIALIAMSGIRVCDAELLELGLTLPGFVERSKTIASLPSLSLLTLAGIGRDEHEYVYFEVRELDDLAPLSPDFDLVAISSLSAQILEAYQLADRLRLEGFTVVMGGLHVSSLPDEAALHADAIVVGEGEPVWASLLADAAAGELKPLYRSGQFELAHAPMPAFELLDMDAYNRITIQTSRGCPFKCEFCASSILLTPRYKQKPVERVLAELDRVRELWPRPFIEFADDNSFINRRYWLELLPELARRRIRWFTETDLAIHDDPELLARMREAGCAQVLIGFESPSPAALSGVERKTDWKRKRWSEYKTAIRHIQEHGIRVNGCFVVGLDGHTPSVFDDVYEFALESELHDVQVTLPTPFPGTPFYERLKRAGRLTHDGQWDRCTLFDLNFVPDGMPPEALRMGFHGLVRRLYDDPVTHWRRANFKRRYARPALAAARRQRVPEPLRSAVG